MKKHRIALGVVAIIFVLILSLALYACFFPNPIYLKVGITEDAKTEQLRNIWLLVGLALSVVLLRHWLARQVTKLPYLMDVIIAFIILVEIASHGVGLPIPHSHAWLELLIPYFSATRGGRWFITHTRIGIWLTKTAESCHKIRWKEWMVKLIYYINMPFRTFWYYWAK